MEEVKWRMNALGAFPACVERARSWEDVCRAFGKEIEMNRLHEKHGVSLVREVKKAGKLKGIYRELFPEAAEYWDQTFFNPSSSSSPASASTAPPSIPVPVLNTFVHFNDPVSSKPRSKSEEPRSKRCRGGFDS